MSRTVSSVLTLISVVAASSSRLEDSSKSNSDFAVLVVVAGLVVCD